MTNDLAAENWGSFEQVVADLLRALAPKARITHDVVVPDLDTGLPRQRDVWIETTFGDHLPIRILVSCKRTKAKFNQLHMDGFIGELRSSGATHGVVYTASGFTSGALAKGKRLGISCCVLLENGPANLPGMLVFDHYCFRERVHFTIQGDPGEAFPTVNALLNLQVNENGVVTTAGFALAAAYKTSMGEPRQQPIAGTPATWAAAVAISDGVLDEPVTLQLQSGWRAFRARVEALLVNGSYCFNNEDFKGSYSGPVVDRLGEHPGPDWEEIALSDVPGVGNRIWMLFYGGDTEAALREQLGHRKPTEFGGAVQ